MLIQGVIQTFITFQGTLSAWWTRIIIALLLCLFIVTRRWSAAAGSASTLSTDFSQSSFLLFSGTVTRHVLVAVSISGGFGMDALLIKTGGLLLIVALGYLLKRRGVFQQGDAVCCPGSSST